MKTNAIEKGMMVQLANGLKGIMYDNKKGNIRMVKVYGLYIEIGSVYAWDIVGVLIDDCNLVNVELTPSQLKAKNFNYSLFGG